MKVAVAAAGNTLEASSDPRFGRCAYFVLVDTADMTATALANPGAQIGQGAGIQAAQAVANAGVEAVIAANMGPNASQALTTGGITVYAARGGSVRAEVEALQRGELTVLTGPNVAAHNGMGGGGIGMGRGQGRGFGGGRGR